MLLPDEDSGLSNKDYTEMHIDLSSRVGVDKLFDEALNHFGEIDAFIANAGIAYYENPQFMCRPERQANRYLYSSTEILSIRYESPAYLIIL